MNHITLKEVSTIEEKETFWRVSSDCFFNDSIPHDDLGAPITEEEKEIFSTPEYREHIDSLCTQTPDPAHKIFFYKDGVQIGYCLYCTYLSQDAKCFILDYCIYREYRDRGYGKDCFLTLKREQVALGASFFELNTASTKGKRFWESLGFLENGYDAYGTLLMLIPPTQTIPTYDIAQQSDIWQILMLENSYLAHTNQPFLTQEDSTQLTCGITSGQIIYYVIRRDTRVIGICSIHPTSDVTQGFPTEHSIHFYIQPAFGKNGFSRPFSNYVLGMWETTGLHPLVLPNLY